MAMRVDNGINVFNFGTQRLGAEIRRSVDQNVAIPEGYKNGRAQAIIARIGRGAHRAVTPGSRHADTRARAQDRNFDGIRQHSGVRSSRIAGFLGNLDKAEAQFGEGILQQSLLVETEIALRFF